MPKFDRKRFFEGFRKRIDPTIEQEQVEGLNFLLGQMEADPFWKHIPQIAYALATTYHETAGSFQPVEEGYYLGSKTRVKNFQKSLRYYPWYGRGYVQLTWKANYQKAKDILNVDFIKNPAAVMEPKNSYDVLTFGMHQGWFTGKKLDDYIKNGKKDYTNARKIINGLDKAGLIAGYARSFEQILTESLATNSTAAPAELPTLKPSNEQLPQESTASTPPPITEPLPAVSTVAVEVPQVAASTEQPKEDTLTKIGNKVNAMYTAIGGTVAGVIAWFSTASGTIVLAVVGAVALIGVVYMITNAIRAELKERRDLATAEKDKARAHEIQMLSLKSHADPHMQSVVIAPPPATEMANDTQEVNA